MPSTIYIAFFLSFLLYHVSTRLLEVHLVLIGIIGFIVLSFLFIIFQRKICTNI